MPTGKSPRHRRREDWPSTFRSSLASPFVLVCAADTMLCPGAQTSTQPPSCCSPREDRTLVKPVVGTDGDRAGRPRRAAHAGVDASIARGDDVGDPGIDRPLMAAIEGHSRSPPAVRPMLTTAGLRA